MQKYNPPSFLQQGILFAKTNVTIKLREKAHEKNSTQPDINLDAGISGIYFT